MRRFSLPTIITATLLIVLFGIYLVTFQVRFSQVVVRVTLGKADENSVVDKPGVYFKWPLPFEYTVAYDTRLKTTETPEGEVKTRDGKNLIVRCFVTWRVKEALKFYKVLAEPEVAESRLRGQVNEIRQTVIGRHDISAFFGLDAERIRESHDAIEKEMLDGVKADLQAKYGMEIVSVNLGRISLPESATQEVFKSMSQERDKQATEYREEGASLAKGIESRAQSAANQILTFASTKAEEIRSEGRRAARPYLEQIESQDREFFLFLRKLEMLEAVLRQQTTFFFDANVELFRPFVTPPTPGGMNPAAAPLAIDGAMQWSTTRPAAQPRLNVLAEPEKKAADSHE